MIGLKPYPEARTITLPWLQTVPPHWDVRRIKTLLREYDNRTKTGEERLLSLRMREGIVDHLESGGKPVRPTDLIGYKVVEPGVLIMNRMRASSGLFGVASIGGLVSPDYATFRPASSANTGYLLYLFKTPMLAEVFRPESRGLGTGEAGFLRLYTDRFGAIKIPVPPVPEQQLIVRFLDTHGASTARVIRGKQRPIKLLEEQKQAIIHRAVTRGLDLNVRLKPSGTPWLGDVPEHWEVVRLRNLVSHVTSGSRGWSRYASDAGPLFVRIGNLTRSSIDIELEDIVRLNLPKAVLGETERTRIQPDDILLSITAYIGSVAVVPRGLGEAYVSQHVACCRPRKGAANPKWLGYVLLSPVGQIHGTLCMYGGTKQGLSLDDVKNHVMVLPPAAEQDAFVARIESETASLDSGIRSVQREIALYREFHDRLVAEVVTGKLDVRAAAAALLEITESELIDEPIDGEDFEEALDDIEDEVVAA